MGKPPPARKKRQERRQHEEKEKQRDARSSNVPQQTLMKYSQSSDSLSRFSAQPTEEYFQQLTSHLTAYWKRIKERGQVNLLNAIDTCIDARISHAFPPLE